MYHGNNHPRNPEEDFCILAQHAKKACNPAGIILPELSSRAGVMAFKGGGMRTLVRAHDEVPCITAIIPSRNPEEDFCTSAQPERSEGNPAVWGLSKRVRQPRGLSKRVRQPRGLSKRVRQPRGLSKRVRQPRSTRQHGPHFPKEETCIPAQHARMACNPALSAVLGLRGVHIRSSAR